jgi:hypothetical protein
MGGGVNVTANEWVFACVIVVAATIGAIFHVLDPTAYAGLLGTAIGYAGKGVIVDTREKEK